MNKQETGFIITVAIIGFVLLVGQLQSASEVDMGNPIRSSAQDEISLLPGLNNTPSFRQYSGYLAADKTNNQFLHYWLVESQSRPSEDPLVLWLDGGPGCSSLFGMLKELGPFLFDDKHEQLVENKFAWNQHANILFLESPAGVGYSYAADSNITTNDDMTAEANYLALISFFNKFPKFKNRFLYLTGQSYAGVYIPMLANLVDKNRTMNLKGISVGNGFFDDILLMKSKLLFSRYHGLIGSTTWYDLTTKCCHNEMDRTGLCDMGRKLNNSTLDAQTDCFKTLSGILDKVDDLNIDYYNIYADCDSLRQTDNVVPRRRRRSNFVNSTEENFEAKPRLDVVDQTLKSVSTLHLLSSSNNLPCEWNDKTPANYLDSLQMRKALHIPSQLSGSFKMCASAMGYSYEIYEQKYARLLGGMRRFFYPLMQSDRKLKILIYYGDFDYVCDFIGGEMFVDNLNDTLVSDHSPWFVGKRLAGFVKRFENITFMTVRGSGHSVPKDKPAEALHLFEKYLLGLPPSSRSKIAI